jgi:hypothetical protein
MSNSIYVVIFVVGFLAGWMTTLGVARHRGHKIVLPFITDSSRNFTIMATVLALLSLYSIVQIERSNSRDEARAVATQECFTKFAGALSYNADGVGVELRKLENERISLNDRFRVQTGDLVQGIASALAQGQPTPGQLDAVLGPFNVETDRIDSRLSQIADETARLNAQRAPYPSPVCN